MDKIRIKKLEIFANHGVYPEENRLGQKFVVSIDLFMDTRAAGRSDDLHLTVNYGDICRCAKDFLESHTFALLEAAADSLAEEILLNYPLVQSVRLELEKPWAPVKMPIDSVSVEVERTWHLAVLSVGSNMGNKEAYIRMAFGMLGERKDCRVKRVSELLETAPYGYTEQDSFLNAAILLETLQTADELLDTLHEIEQKAGRERKLHWGPRTLDLDIIYYDDQTISTADLTIPHPDMQNRYFVLEPIRQIAPFLRHPLTGKTAEEMLEALKHR